MRLAITGAATGDVLGWYHTTLETVEDIQGRIAYNIRSYSEATSIMQMWSWNV